MPRPGFDDALYLAGAAAVTYGAHLIYQPAAYIVGGLFALGLAYLIRGRV